MDITKTVTILFSVAIFHSEVMMAHVVPSPACSRLSFTRRTGNNFEHNGQDVGRCHPIFTISLPTEISLHGESDDAVPCSYKLRYFSDLECSAEIENGEYPLSSAQNKVILNQRNPICSYKLRYDPQTSVTIRFTGTSNETHELVRSGCHNLGTYCSKGHPQYVELYSNRPGNRPEHNHIQLFSESDCDEDAIIKYQNGATEVIREDNLHFMTLVNRRQIAASFMIVHA